MLQNPFYSSRNFSLCGKKKKQKQGEPTAFSNRWEDEEAREEGKGRGQYSPRKEFDEREFSLRGGRACKRRKEFFLTPVIPFIARGTARHSAPACNGPGYWRVAVLMNFGVHVLRETRGTSRMPPDVSATLARYWRGNSRNPGGTPRGERKRLSLTFWEHWYPVAIWNLIREFLFYLGFIELIIDYYIEGRKFGKVWQELKIEDIWGKI